MSITSQRKRKLSDHDIENPIQRKKQKLSPTDTEETDHDSKDEHSESEQCLYCRETSNTLIHCFECDDFGGCLVNDCIYEREHGLHCAKCERYFCYICNRVQICQTCLEMYCIACMEFKPHANGEWQCNGCQPQWKKKRNTSEFCNGCSSTSNQADICYRCRKRFCKKCQEKIGDMGICKTCDRFHCYYYSCHNHDHQQDHVLSFLQWIPLYYQ
eukprot:456512_1